MVGSWAVSLVVSMAGHWGGVTGVWMELTAAAAKVF